MYTFPCNSRYCREAPPGELKDHVHLCVLHQNRTRHTSNFKNFVPETHFPHFMHMVVWYAQLIFSLSSWGDDVVLNVPCSLVDLNHFLRWFTPQSLTLSAYHFIVLPPFCSPSSSLLFFLPPPFFFFSFPPSRVPHRGHEHECKVLFEQGTRGLRISQPGSSVATSLSNVRVK